MNALSEPVNAARKVAASSKSMPTISTVALPKAVWAALGSRVRTRTGSP
jgi:hypothetical protein